MKKLYFRYGAMNCGKSTALMQVAHNYNEKGKKVVVIKSSIDTKADDKLESRLGIRRPVDILIDHEESFKPYYNDWKKEKVDCILVDEAQFLSAQQVEELWYVTKKYEIPVICYGLKTDFQSELFEGSKRLIELADELEELYTICECGSKARFNARFVNDNFTLEGDSVLIDGSQSNVEYRPLCGKCYLKNKEKVLKRQNTVNMKKK